MHDYFNYVFFSSYINKQSLEMRFWSSSTLLHIISDSTNHTRTNKCPWTIYYGSTTKLLLSSPSRNNDTADDMEEDQKNDSPKTQAAQTKSDIKGIVIHQSLYKLFSNNLWSPQGDGGRYTTKPSRILSIFLPNLQ
jgi:hypothetical protein